jgi:hypothetical protein
MITIKVVPPDKPGCKQEFSSIHDARVFLEILRVYGYDAAMKWATEKTPSNGVCRCGNPKSTKSPCCAECIQDKKEALSTPSVTEPSVQRTAEWFCDNCKQYHPNEQRYCPKLIRVRRH